MASTLLLRYCQQNHSVAHPKCCLQFGDPQGGRQLAMRNKVEFGAGSEMTHADEAIMGLQAKPSDTETAIFHAAWQEGVLDQPVFSVALKRCQQGNCADAGRITFGGEDQANCGPVEKWVPILAHATHWMFNMHGLRVNGRFIPLQMEALSDTGSSHINLPPQAFDQVMGALRVS